MKIYVTTIILLTSLLFGIDNISQKECHIDNVNYIMCKYKKVLIPFNEKKAQYYLKSDIPEKQLAIFSREPIGNTESVYEYYFILDYKNMMIYDNLCLNTNFVAEKKGKILLFPIDTDIQVFEKSNFSHCKEPLKEWVKKPFKPYN